MSRTDASPDLLDKNLQSPLHVACKHNHESIARFLVGLGADVNLQD